MGIVGIEPTSIYTAIQTYDGPKISSCFTHVA